MEWEEFEQGLIFMYGNLEVIDYSGRLTKLKQKHSTFDEYIKEIIRLSHQVDGLSSKFLTSCLISGLRHTGQLELLAKQPRTIRATIRLARRRRISSCLKRKP